VAKQQFDNMMLNANAQVITILDGAQVIKKFINDLAVTIIRVLKAKAIYNIEFGSNRVKPPPTLTTLPRFEVLSEYNFHDFGMALG
jgi:signal-transduction protein with cAMP-binding, CBS, and nucleotidyltransferase domain